MGQGGEVEAQEGISADKQSRRRETRREEHDTKESVSFQFLLHLLLFSSIYQSSSPLKLLLFLQLIIIREFPFLPEKLFSYFANQRGKG